MAGHAHDDVDRLFHARTGGCPFENDTRSPPDATRSTTSAGELHACSGECRCRWFPAARCIEQESGHRPAGFGDGFELEYGAGHRWLGHEITRRTSSMSDQGMGSIWTTVPV